MALVSSRLETNNAARLPEDYRRFWRQDVEAKAAAWAVRTAAWDADAPGAGPEVFSCDR